MKPKLGKSLTYPALGVIAVLAIGLLLLARYIPKPEEERVRYVPDLEEGIKRLEAKYTPQEITAEIITGEYWGCNALKQIDIVTREMDYWEILCGDSKITTPLTVSGRTPIHHLLFTLNHYADKCGCWARPQMMK